MKTNITLFILAFFISILLLSCTSDDSVTVIPGNNNILVSSTFEIFGRPSFEGWQPNYTDTSTVNFVQTAPSSGGTFSVRLKNEWMIPGVITYNIMGMSGTHRYKFSIWEKGSSERGIFSLGSMSFHVYHEGTVTYGNSLSFHDIPWTNQILLDTLTTSPTDTIAVNISGSWSQSSAGYIFVDLCKLEIIE